MGEHFPRSTVSVAAWCKRCNKSTHHRVDDRRKGPCLECIAKLERDHAAAQKPATDKQMNFFGDAA
jgi:ribosomal protein L44E